MAESGLSLGWPELKQEVGFYLGYGTTIGNWGAHATEIELIVQSGYRRVLYPPAVGQFSAGYNWSFLRPTGTLAIVADDGDYDLPDDFGQMVGELHYAPDQHRPAIRIIQLAALLDMRSHSDQNSNPHFAAIRYKSSDGTTGQRQEILFYPESDADYTLYYSYDAYTGKLSNSVAYPLGGMHMSELYKESCLALAEFRNNEEIGPHYQMFTILLADAIARDMKKGAQNFGDMRDGGMRGCHGTWIRGQELYDGAYSITYKGSQI